ncbi:hypothetical protein NGTWS0302_18030 [Mycolicibacterium cyprinidarum]|uniref:Uncharacterized protein n=1 Tax=Mycolicibacterium cyprinidarum TaxID=2860311 RepID=A0ABQ4V9W7_9MYCO|nr:hypothetical protein NGTWS1702_12740 [Mycolicibacterium sp. NGTWSNA01]GJF19275.1 hypothetical protein NGTWS0302_18030 [Mycolicibacterium sp. NGTWS0302]GJF19620.1 hypothetical protein NGTWS1803_09600 [Mycolicibacterium sp. NGTWS1803]
MGAKRVRRIASALACAGAMVVVGAALPAQANAEPVPPPLPVFIPGPTDWSPNVDIWEYHTFIYQWTPEMLSGMSDSCQWFNAQFDPLMGQIYDFNRTLGDNRDDYSVGNIQQQANAVVANIDQSTAFLAPRVQPLTIENNLNNFGPYSPLYGGEAITSVTFQLTRIAESMRTYAPAGVTHANIVAATGWGNTLRDLGACN